MLNNKAPTTSSRMGALYKEEMQMAFGGVDGGTCGTGPGFSAGIAAVVCYYSSAYRNGNRILISNIEVAILILIALGVIF